MKITLNLGANAPSIADVIVLGTFSKKEKKGKKEVTTPSFSNWAKDCKDAFLALGAAKSFTGDAGTQITFDCEGQRVLAIGLGDKSAYDNEAARRAASSRSPSRSSPRSRPRPPRR